MHTATSAASELLPVRPFTQMPAARIMALPPIEAAVVPSRYRRAFGRSRVEVESTRLMFGTVAAGTCSGPSAADQAEDRGLRRAPDLDRGVAPRHPAGMTENPYAIPVEEFLARTRVPVTDQVELHVEPQTPPADASSGTGLYGDGDGASGDADGD